MSYSSLTLSSSPAPSQASTARQGARLFWVTTLAAALATIALFASPAHAQPQTQTQDSAAKPQQPALSRAEVIADLALWRRAGADRYETLSRSYGIETQSYDRAYEEYVRLRQSDAFQAEVQKAADKR